MRKIIGYITIIAIPLLIAYLYFEHYANSGDIWSKQCSFHQLTDMECPGCGGQRAFYHLLHGNILTALQYNALLIIGLPFFIYIYFLLCKVYIIRDKEILKRVNLPPYTGYIVIAILLIFFILRNIPVWPFTLLAPPQ